MKLLIGLLCAVPLAAQWQAVPGTQYPALEAILNAKPAAQTGSGAPAGNCTTAKDFYVDTTAHVLYYCSATNTWLKAVNADSSGNVAISGTLTDGTTSIDPAAGVSSPALTTSGTGTGYMGLLEGTVPATPATNYQRVYISSSNHHLTRVDATGTTTDIEAGAGGAPGNGYYFVSRSTNTPTNGVNFGALSSGILKHTVSGGVSTPSVAAASDVVALFSTCSGTQYLGADGACHNSGTGDVTGGSNLTTTKNVPYISASGTLNQDANTLCIDSTNHRVGIGTCSPAQFFDANSANSAGSYFDFRNTYNSGNRKWEIAIAPDNGPTSMTWSGLTGRLNFASNTFLDISAPNVYIGPTQVSSSSGTLTVADATATTGATRVNINLGAADSASTTVLSVAGRVAIGVSTPSTSGDACTAGSIWTDASFIYVCVSSGTIKRATLSTF
jgi:hypothetical protein